MCLASPNMPKRNLTHDQATGVQATILSYPWEFDHRNDEQRNYKKIHKRYKSGRVFPMKYLTGAVKLS